MADVADNEAAVPAAVRRQQEQAEQARKTRYESQPDTPDEDGAQGDEGEQAGTQEPTDDESAQPEPQAGADTDEETDWQAEYRKLESAYNTLRGKYDAEVPRLSKQLREVQQEVEKLRQPQQAGADSTGNESLDQEIEKHRKELADEIGEEFADKQIRLMKALARREDNATAHNIRQEVDQVKQDQQHTREERFWSTLRERVSDWESINHDTAFYQDFLGEVIPETGETRQQALDRAAQELDADRVARIFEMFKERRGQQQQESAEERRRKQVESQVEPGRKKRGADKQPTEKPSWKASDVKELEAKHRRGDITLEQFNERMADIQKAIQEGRYRG